MTIYFYEGRVGSGKSYHLVNEVIIPNLKAGNKIFTNIPLVPEAIEGEFFHVGYLLDRIIVISPENFLEYASNADSFPLSIWVIDECHEFFWSHKPIGDEAVLQFFALHRKFLAHICLASQHRDKVAKKIVKEVETFCVFEDHRPLGFKNKYQYTEYYSGKSKPLYKKKHSYDSSKFKYYHSFDPKYQNLISKYKPARKSKFSLIRMALSILVPLAIAGFAISNFGRNSIQAKVPDKASVSTKQGVIQNAKENISKVNDPGSGSPGGAGAVQVVEQVTVFTPDGPVKVGADWVITGAVTLGDKTKYVLESPEGKSFSFWSYSKPDLFWRVSKS